MSLHPDKLLPAPVAKSYPYEIDGGRRNRGWGGHHFELIHQGLIHYIILQGVDSPPEEHRLFRSSYNRLTRLLRDQQLRVVVVGRDEMFREIARVYANDVDVNLRMIESGLGWYNGAEFADAELFLAAEQQARTNQVGVWKKVKKSAK